MSGDPEQDYFVDGFSEIPITGRVATSGSVRRIANVASWLKADIQSPEIEVRFTPESRHFRGRH